MERIGHNIRKACAHPKASARFKNQCEVPESFFTNVSRKLVTKKCNRASSSRKDTEASLALPISVKTKRTSNSRWDR